MVARMVVIHIEHIATSDPRQRAIVAAVHRQYQRFAARRWFQQFLQRAEMLCQVEDYLTAVGDVTTHDDRGWKCSAQP